MIVFLTRAGRGVRAAALVAVSAATLGAVAGCSSGSSTTTNTTVAGGGAAGSATTAATTGGTSQSDQLNAFAGSLKSGQQVAFKADYSYTGSGNPGMVTIEQKPPKTLFKSGQGEVIGTGTATYFCSTSGGKATCLGGGTGTANPLAAITQLFNPQSALTAIQAAQAQIEAKAAGYNVTFSTQSFAGVDANCVTVTASGQVGKYCVTKSGILAYGGSGTDNFQLTSFSTTVSDSDFTLPAGATTVTIPGVP